MTKCAAFGNRDDKDEESDKFVQIFSNLRTIAMKLFDIILSMHLMEELKIDIPMNVNIVTDIFYDFLYMNGTCINDLDEDIIIGSEIKCNVDWNDQNC